MQEIKNLDDIKQMVDTFYDKVNKDKELSYIFNDFYPRKRKSFCFS